MTDALTLHSYSTLDSQVEAIKRDGFAFFPGILRAETIVALRDCMDRLQPIAENYDWNGTPENTGFLNKAINSTFNRDALFLNCLDIPGVIELAEAIHGSDCHIIQMTAWMTDLVALTKRYTPIGSPSHYRKILLQTRVWKFLSLSQLLTTILMIFTKS